MFVLDTAPTDWWVLLLGSGVVVGVAGWIGRWLLLWLQRIRYELKLQGDLTGMARISVTNRGKTPASVSSVRILVRKIWLYRLIYLAFHLRPVGSVLLVEDETKNELTQNQPVQTTLSWDASERPLPPHRPWQRKWPRRSWEQREIRVRVVTVPRRPPSHHKLDWGESGFAPPRTLCTSQKIKASERIALETIEPSVNMPLRTREVEAESSFPV
jgi:hypothetical protein